MSVSFVNSNRPDGQKGDICSRKYCLLSREDVLTFSKLTYDALKILGNSPDPELSLKALFFSKLSKNEVIRLLIPDEQSEQLALLEKERDRLQKAEERLEEALKSKNELETEDPDFFAESFSNYTELRNIDKKLSEVSKKHAVEKNEGPANLGPLSEQINFLRVKKLDIEKNIKAAKKTNNIQDVRICMLEINISCSQDEINQCKALIAGLEDCLQ